MKKSTVCKPMFVLKSLCFVMVFASCVQDKMTDLAVPPIADLGYETNNVTEGEKYLPAEKGKQVTGQYIVQLKDEFIMPGALVDTLSKSGREDQAKSAESRQNASGREIQHLMTEFGLSNKKSTQIYTEAISGFATELTGEEVKRLLADDRVLSVAEDFMVDLDVPEIQLLADMPEAQMKPCGITRHNGSNAGPTSKWIWIVDSGIFQHADLNVVTNSTYARSFVDGYPFYDCSGHGTHVAGTAAAKNNSFGVVGMSPGASVVPVKVFGCGQSPASTILAGINHVAIYDEPGDVCNLSLGGYFGPNCSNYSPYSNAVKNMAASGTRVVIASGNDGQDANYFAPGCINATRIYTVANMDCNNQWNWSSNYGVGPVDWIAVGTNVLSTLPNNQYGYMSGTSMSAPHVSGIVHVRQNAPAQCGWVYRYNVGYKVACR